MTECDQASALRHSRVGFERRSMSSPAGRDSEAVPRPNERVARESRGRIQLGAPLIQYLGGSSYSNPTFSIFKANIDRSLIVVVMSI